MERLDHRIEPARAADCAVLLDLIRELADYERLSDQVVATAADLATTLFGPRPYAEALLATVEAAPVGFALFFHNYSTFLGRPGLYLEDLFVRPACRGHGIGRALLARVAALAVARGCGRLEWSVLDWNVPALEFYRRQGAVALDDWTVLRLSGQALHALARSSAGGG